MSRKLLWLSLLLLSGAFVYWPGLSGSFLLDDQQNLKTLDRMTAPITPEKLGSVVFSNTAGDLGRPLPMLSFAAQYASWPDHPETFKAVNLGLHLTNGILIYLVVILVLRLREPSSDRASILALATTGLWLLHPLQVSTVLYVVQRMTEMAAFFMLGGLAIYLSGRKLVNDRPLAGYVRMLVGLVLGATLGLASKEIAVLLPLYILVLEVTLLREVPRPKMWRWWFWGGLCLPLFIFWGYLAAKFSSWILPSYALRDFSLDERLLTEARILWDYIGQMLIPRASSLGLFHDDIVVSRSLLSPYQTLIAIVGWVFLIFVLIKQWQRWPVPAFGVLWFLAGHSLESSVLPLELYFEHRNYLPLAGVMLALVLEVDILLQRGLISVVHRTFMLGVGAWALLLCSLTLQQSLLWGDFPRLAATWAQSHPNSDRAQGMWAAVLSDAGRSEVAARIYAALAARKPGAEGYLLVWRAAGCRLGATMQPSAPSILAALEVGRFSHEAIGALENMVVAKEEHDCPGIESQEILSYMQVLLKNPAFLSRSFQLHVLSGRLMAAVGNVDDAAVDFAEAFRQRNDVEVALLWVKVLAGARRLDEALAVLDLASKANSAYGISRFSYARDIENWARNLEFLRQHENARLL